jgi:hypothetical protein
MESLEKREDFREAYEQPLLIDQGSMHDVTQGILGLGPDGPFMQQTIIIPP